MEVVEAQPLDPRREDHPTMIVIGIILGAFSIGLRCWLVFALAVYALPLIVPVTVVGANIFEWFLHLQVMHRPRPALMDMYKRHTLAHHQFFTESEPFHDTTRDYRVAFSAIRLIAFL